LCRFKALTILSLRNLGRRKIKTIPTVVSISIGVAMIASLLSITSDVEVNPMNAIRAMGGTNTTSRYVYAVAKRYT